MEYKIVSPLSVPSSKTKNFTLNLNNYRNTHYRELNQAKNNYHYIIWEEIKGLPFFYLPISMKFIWIPGDNRKYDRSNILSIHEKFFMDALVKGNPYTFREQKGRILHRSEYKLEDDNDRFTVSSYYITSAVEPKKARVEIVLYT